MSSTERLSNDRGKGDKMTRFDINANMQKFLAIALTTGTIDAADLLVLAVAHGSDLAAIRDEIMQYAFNNRHGKPEAHDMLCDANDLCAVG